MSPLLTYRRLIGLAGPSYVLVAFLGRLPLAMSQMGTMLLVAGTTGRYAAGGLAAGALALTNAVGAPVAGGIADRIGQRPVVLVQSLAGAALLLAEVVLARSGADVAVLVAVAGLAGLVLPQVGPLARVRWRPITSGTGPAQRRLVDAAFSYEGAADEASFVLGPALIGLLVALGDPGVALVTAAVLLAVFGTAFAAHPTARLTGGGRVRGAAAARLVSAAFLVLLAGQVCVGLLFGSIQTGASALTRAEGVPAAAGGVHACLGVGSVLAGLATAFLPERVGHERRSLVAALALVLLATPLLLVDTVAQLVAVVLLLGLGVAPYMIGLFTLGERVVPPSRVGAALTLLAGATGIGYAVGSATAGRLADEQGATGAFAVTVTAAVLALLVVGSQQGRLRRAAGAAVLPEPPSAPDQDLDPDPDPDALRARVPAVGGCDA